MRRFLMLTVILFALSNPTLGFAEEETISGFGDLLLGGSFAELDQSKWHRLMETSYFSPSSGEYLVSYSMVDPELQKYKLPELFDNDVRVFGVDIKDCYITLGVLEGTILEIRIECYKSLEWSCTEAYILNETEYRLSLYEKLVEGAKSHYSAEFFQGGYTDYTERLYFHNEIVAEFADAIGNELSFRIDIHNMRDIYRDYDLDIGIDFTSFEFADLEFDYEHYRASQTGT